MKNSLSCYNGYNFGLVGRGKHKYDKLLDYVAKNYDKMFTRKQLLIDSGYTDYIPSSGHLCSLTSAMNYYDILHYDTHEKMWMAGENFFEVYGIKCALELRRNS